MAGIHDSTSNVLNKFELTRNHAITFGAYLLFTSNDYAIISSIEAGWFASETVIKDSLTIRGDLFAEVETVINFVKKQ